MKTRKHIVWTIVGSLLLFGGWVIKDNAVFHGNASIGRLLMSFGFIIIAMLIFFYMKETFNDKPK